MADNNYPLPIADAATGELRCPPGYVVTQPAGQGIARASPPDMLVRAGDAVGEYAPWSDTCTRHRHRLWTVRCVTPRRGWK